ncbi:MAG: FAA hydrolase family protein [Sphingobacteriales bacterium]|jgi:acylpyruvate hydrolase|nr:MAG: FAA hydrolase family protein [Sphingobacteriales bacterium]
MKIIAIGRNYAEHTKELNNTTPTQPVIFLKPDTAVLKNNQAFYHPDFSTNIHHEVEVIVKISKEGKYIAKKFAHKYYNEVSVGIDFTARDIQEKLKQNGLPWAIAKAFDNSAPVGSFISKEGLNLANLNFRLEVNNSIKQQGNTSDMLFTIDDIIAFASQYFTLKKGDLLFTGTPAGVGKIHIGDRLTGYIEDMKLLDFEVK